jgi:hypothetical protein
MLLITAPPGHENYFDELRDLIAKGGKPDSDALAELRAKYDTVQLATLTPAEVDPVSCNPTLRTSGWGQTRSLRRCPLQDRFSNESGSPPAILTGLMQRSKHGHFLDHLIRPGRAGRFRGA